MTGIRTAPRTLLIVLAFIVALLGGSVVHATQADAAGGKYHFASSASSTKRDCKLVQITSDARSPYRGQSINLKPGQITWGIVANRVKNVSGRTCVIRVTAANGNVLYAGTLKNNYSRTFARSSSGRITSYYRL